MKLISKALYGTLLIPSDNKYLQRGYVRELNNHPISFDEKGNLTDLVTGEKGTMMLPGFTVRGINPKTRARNYSSAYHPEDALEFLDIMTRPITAPIIPSTLIGAIRNTLNGGSYYKSLMGIEPNLGITTENFNREHPYLSAGTNLTFDMLFPFGLKGINKGINTTSTFVGKKYVTPYMASKILNRAVSANPKGQILVSDNYFNSPNNWYRISNTPEVYGIKEMGKNVTTRDSGTLIDVPSDNWRTSVLELPLIRDKEGYLALDPQEDFVEFSNWDNFSADKLNFSPRLFQKSGSAHGNRTQAAKGLIWKGGISNSSMFPTIVIEGEAALQVPMGLTRTKFKLSPWEDIPMGHRIGFKTGEMPMENLGYFQDLKNGKYSYLGLIIPDKRINMLSSNIESTSSKPNNFTDRVSLKFFERPASKLTDLERAGVPKVDRNLPLNTHLKGDKAVLMFKEYGGVEIPSNSINGELLAKYVLEARIRYGLVGNTDISDKEIVQSLYKHASELGKRSAAKNTLGEPLLLFRGDTKRYTKLKPRPTPEELEKMGGTMDNSLGNLFLGQMPESMGGLERYIVHVRDFGGDKRIIGSGTGSKAVLPNGNAVKEFTNDVIGTIPEGSYLLYSYPYKYGNISAYKLPASWSESGVNDINAFVVRTPNMRNASKEISVLNDDFIILGGSKVNYYGPIRRKVFDKDGFPQIVDETGKVVGDGLAGSSDRSAMAKHYRQVLDKAKNEQLGLLKSDKNSLLRDEHDNYDYFALPNFNIRGAKHILPYDLRIPRDWNNPNIYKAFIPIGVTTYGFKNN